MAGQESLKRRELDDIMANEEVYRNAVLDGISKKKKKKRSLSVSKVKIQNHSNQIMLTSNAETGD